MSICQNANIAKKPNLSDMLTGVARARSRFFQYNDSNVHYKGKANQNAPCCTLHANSQLKLTTQKLIHCNNVHFHITNTTAFEFYKNTKSVYYSYRGIQNSISEGHREQSSILVERNKNFIREGYTKNIHYFHRDETHSIKEEY